MSLREFLGYGLAKTPPEHSTLSKTRKRLSPRGPRGGVRLGAGTAAGVGAAERQDVGCGLDDAGGQRGDAHESFGATTGRSTRNGWRGVAAALGIEAPTREDLAKLDGKRPHKGWNKGWSHPNDPEARITKMK
ncbi:MAG: transposase [Gemmatimonadetes bacterium]|nr:transposase [Gemmatimonadota bacterium]MCY3942790.1 transposase [Gemmatimonadota bacterium]